jgi:hydrogenase expression/formation protein HypE
MQELITETISSCLADVLMDIENDATTLPFDQPDKKIMMTTDGFTVNPLEFPGGDIGSLAIHGTVNDLAVSAATPAYLSVSLFIEEGLQLAKLKRLLTSMAAAAREANIKIACGDTKVVPRGQGSELYISTTGIGYRDPEHELLMENIQDGDAILISGPVGNHGVAVMLAREQYGLKGNLKSDSANVLPLTQALLALPGLRYMRDPTRGGLVTVLHEIRQKTNLGIRINADRLPVEEPVMAVCEMLGYDPLYLACEGRVVVIVDPKQAEQALATWHQHPQGKQAALIGHISKTETHLVLETSLGGERILEELEDDPLPRIC